MKKIFKLKNTTRYLLFIILPVCTYGCKSSKLPPVSSLLPCAAPTAVNCGTWINIAPPYTPFQPFLIQNTTQVSLYLTNPANCASNSGVIQIPSVSGSGVIELTTFLNCSTTNGDVCLCTGNSYLPEAGVTVNLTGQYALSLTCVNTITGELEIFTSVGNC